MRTIAKPIDNGELARVMDPLTEMLTPALARRLAQFRADAATRARINELASKCTEGELTPTERREYDGYVRAINIISILQSKARMVLAKTRKT